MSSVEVVRPAVDSGWNGAVETFDDAGFTVVNGHLFVAPSGDEDNYMAVFAPGEWAVVRDVEDA